MAPPFDLCARVQNAFRARIARVCVDHSNQNLGILNVLLRHGFVSSLIRGTAAGPSPDAFILTTNAAHRRIWAELKYRDDRPVLNTFQLISKPSKRIYMDNEEILRFCSGRRAQQVTPLGMGEIAIVRTSNKEHEFVEAREAVQLGLSGEVLCRAR